MFFFLRFDNVVSATNAKIGLNGRDIYSGGCTLKIEYSKAERLNVTSNSKRTWLLFFIRLLQMMLLFLLTIFNELVFSLSVCVLNTM